MDVFGICSELAQGRVLPAGWTSGYDNQNRQYFVDEVLQLLAPTCPHPIPSSVKPRCMQVKRESTWQHPLLPYYRGAVYMALGGKAAVAEAETTKPCTDAEVWLI